MSWGPRSLRGQVLLAVLAALLLAQVVGLGMSLIARDRIERQIRISQALDSAAALVMELDRTPAGERRRLLRAAESPFTRHHIDDRPALAASDPGLQGWLDRLDGALSAPGGARLHLERPGPPPRLEPPGRDEDATRPERERDFRRRALARGLSGYRLGLSLPLADGRWLNSSIRFPGPDPGFRNPANPTLLLSALAIALVLWVVLARMLGPLRRLSQAAESLGRGEAQVLPVTGPSEIRALTAAFNTMQDRLQRLVRDRTQMLAALGHDLRSPLTALRLRVEMLDDDEDRARMTASLDEMQDMVEQTLAWARGVWSAEELADLDLAVLIDELAEEARMAGCAVDWAGAAPLILRARPMALRRCLRNLIDNACRYGGGAGIVLEADAAVARVRVTDRGPGIPEDRLAAVFDPFVRLEASRSRETGGTGLGLAIAHGVAQAHGGSVGLENRAGGGLIATLSLPRPQG